MRVPRPLIWMKSVGEKIGRRIEQVGAIVAGGHHADGDAHPRVARLVIREEIRRAEKFVIGEVAGELLGVGDL